MISSILLMSMKKWAQGISWESLDHTKNTHRTADVYVDDATLWVNNRHNISDLKKQMGTDLQKYQEILQWTGGGH